MKTLMDTFLDLMRSGATYDAPHNTFQVKPENIATMQSNDWAQRQHDEFMADMNRPVRSLDDDF
jgi:hypothetical protein